MQRESALKVDHEARPWRGRIHALLLFYPFSLFLSGHFVSSLSSYFWPIFEGGGKEAQHRVEKGIFSLLTWYLLLCSSLFQTGVYKKAMMNVPVLSCKPKSHVNSFVTENAALFQNSGGLFTHGIWKIDRIVVSYLFSLCFSARWQWWPS